MIDFDAEDWIDIVKAKPGRSTPDEACIRISNWKASGRKPSVYITLRGSVKDLALEKGPRFKAQIGGQDLNLLRLVPSDGPDSFASKVSNKSSSSLLLCIGVVDVWPIEPRASTGAKVEKDKAGNPVLILPRDWAKPSEPKPAPRTAPPAPPQKQIPITTRAQGLEMAGKFAAGRPAHNFGDPPPGRSALDNKPITDSPEYLGSIRFQPQERIMCGLLLSREKVSPAAFLAATAPAGARDDRGKEIAGVVISNLRKKFAPLGVEISNDPGVGYFLSERTKEALQRLVDGAR